ncbi:MAG: sporulation protein YtfJ [Clostridiales bacterium]|nr:sporulation protein YtfJ [Clostridiales bacterium]
MDNIESIMESTLSRIKEIVETDNIIGRPIENGDGSRIIPISKVTFGFVTGGGEYSATPVKVDKPYAGGSGGGVSIAPIGFLVCGKESKFIPASGEPTEEKKWTQIAKNLLESLKK